MQNFSLMNWIIVLIPLLLIGGAIFLFGRAIGGRRPVEQGVAERSAGRRSDVAPVGRSVAAPVVAAKEEPADGPSGFRGWLVPVTIGVIVQPIFTIINFTRDGDFADATGPYQYLFVRDIILYALLFILQLCTVYFMLRRARQFASFYTAASILMILLLPLEILSGALLVAFVVGVPIGPLVKVGFTALSSDDAGRWISTSIGLFIWILYVLRSRRVANTFVR